MRFFRFKFRPARVVFLVRDPSASPALLPSWFFRFTIHSENSFTAEIMISALFHFPLPPHHMIVTDWGVWRLAFLRHMKPTSESFQLLFMLHCRTSCSLPWPHRCQWLVMMNSRQSNVIPLTQRLVQDSFLHPEGIATRSLSYSFSLHHVHSHGFWPASFIVK